VSSNVVSDCILRINIRDAKLPCGSSPALKICETISHLFRPLVYLHQASAIVVLVPCAHQNIGGAKGVHVALHFLEEAFTKSGRSNTLSRVVNNNDVAETAVCRDSSNIMQVICSRPLPAWSDRSPNLGPAVAGAVPTIQANSYFRSSLLLTETHTFATSADKASGA